MKLKTKLLAGASTMVIAGSVLAMVGGETAQATITPAGSCQGSVSLVKITTPTKGVGLGDQTVEGVKTSGALATDLVTKTKVNGGGSCTGTVTRPGDLHVPGGANPTLTAKAQASVLLGNASCASGAGAQAADATAANAYPLNGKISWTFNETYTDQITLAIKPYKMAANVSLLGFNPAGADEVDIGGLVTSGADVGAAVSGTIWEDPVAKAPKGTDPSTTSYNTGYNLDLADAVGCADGTPNNANILQVLSGGGGASSTSTLGTTGVPGLSFQFGEA